MTFLQDNPVSSLKFHVTSFDYLDRLKYETLASSVGYTWSTCKFPISSAWLKFIEARDMSSNHRVVWVP
jgi:hypothetical protein